MTQDVSAIIIGAGPSGIAMAHKLKQKLGFNNFTVNRTHSALDVNGV
jgi:cation diffusion facilitator CzcD-associated flavoprotein CzcO